MLIQKQKQITFQIIKTHIFHTFSNLIQQTFTDSQNIFLLFIIQKIIQLLMEFSILFQPQLLKIWNSTNVSTLITLFSTCNPISYIDSDMQIYIILLMVVFLISITLTISFTLILCKIIEKSIFYRIMMILVRIIKLLMIPIYHIICYSMNDLNQQNSIVIQIFCMIFGIILTVILGINIKFYFSPLRNNNLYHKINTDFQFYQFLTNILKILLINRYRLNFSLLTIFLIIQISKNLFIQTSFETFKVEILNKMCSYCNLITYTAIIISVFNNNYNTIFYFWLISIILIFLVILSKIISQKQLIIDIDDCKNITEDKIFNLIEINEQMQHAEQQIFFYFYFGYIVSHTQKCTKQNCYLKMNEKRIFPEIQISQNFNRKNVVDYMNNFTLELIEFNSQISQEFSILNYIILFQTNKLEKLINLQRNVSNLSYEFIIYHLKKLTKNTDNNTNDKITEQNFKQSRIHFFKQFSIVIEQLKNFMNELKQKKTRFDIVEKKGYNIYLQINLLKQLFDKILKSDRVDFNIIQFYLEFMISFLKQQTQTDELVKKIIKKSSIKYVDYNIEDTPVATFQINLKQQKIENVNTEIIKIFNYHKIEMIEKKIQNFIFPEIHQTQVDFNRIFKELLTENSLCFGKNRKNQYFPLKLKSRIKQISNNKKYFLEVSQIKKRRNQTFILLDTKFQPILYSQRQLKLSNNAPSIIIQQLYNGFIKPNILQLQRNQKIELQHADINEISLLKTLNPQYMFIHIKMKVINKNYDIPIKQSKINKIFFSILKQQNSKKSLFIGSKQISCNICDQNQMLKIEQKSISSNMNIKYVKVNYQKGIKSYRVVGDDLINIQLQDKEGNFQTFLNKKQPYQNQYIKNKFRSRILIYVLLLLLILYLTLTIYFSINKFVKVTSLSTLYSNYNMIQSYSLKFYRMLAILRDSLLFNNTNWSTSLLTTFYDLQYLQYSQTGKLFTTTQYIMNYDNLVLNQDLQNLCNNVNTLIFKMGIQKNNYLANQTIAVGSTIIASAMYNQKSNMKSNIYNILNNIQNITMQSFLSYTIILITFFLLLFLIDAIQILKRKQLLIDFRNMSDYQIECLIENLERFEYLLTLNQKNEEVEVLGAVKQQVVYQKREYPKQYQTKFIKNQVYFIFMIILLIIILGIFIYMATLTSLYIQTSSQLLQTNSKFANIYISYLQLSINTSKKINTTIFTQMFDSLQYLQINKWNYPYDQNFTNFLNILMFGNSCSILPNYIDNFNCTTYILNTPIPFPFQQGLIYYLHTMHFSLNQNISECIPSTGINGYPFYKLYGYILNQTLRAWNNQNTIIVTYENSFLGLNIVGFIILVSIFMISYFDNSDKEKKIKLIGKIFRRQDIKDQNIKKNLDSNDIPQI